MWPPISTSQVHMQKEPPGSMSISMPVRAGGTMIPCSDSSKLALCCQASAVKTGRNTRYDKEPDPKGYRRADIGEYRIIYRVAGDTLEVLLIGKRNDDEVYHRFSRR